MNAVEIMDKTKSFAIIGASAKESSYGFELVKVLTDLNYLVFPINPKYPKIYGLKTYANIFDLLEEPNNIVLAMSPANNLKYIDSLVEFKNSYVWLPPECWNMELVEKAESLHLKYLKDDCPIGTYLKLNIIRKARNN